MRKPTEEEAAWLLSPAAVRLRKSYCGKRDAALEALIGASASSTDPKVRHTAASYMTWCEALKELKITNESDG